MYEFFPTLFYVVKIKLVASYKDDLGSPQQFSFLFLNFIYFLFF